MHSFYWAFQTITTVGYGDFSITTNWEFVLCLFWMIIGVNFYTYVIGSVSSIIVANDNQNAILNQKLNTLNDYSKKYELPKDVQNKIDQFFKNKS